MSDDELIQQTILEQHGIIELHEDRIYIDPLDGIGESLPRLQPVPGRRQRSSSVHIVPNDAKLLRKKQRDAQKKARKINRQHR